MPSNNQIINCFFPRVGIQKLIAQQQKLGNWLFLVKNSEQNFPNLFVAHDTWYFKQANIKKSDFFFFQNLVYQPNSLLNNLAIKSKVAGRCITWPGRLAPTP